MRAIVVGIYAIRHIATDRVYVGSSRDVQQRLNGHRRQLRNGQHHSIKLQRSWDRHGLAAFAFRLLETVDDLSTLLVREQHWMDTLDAAAGINGNGGFNISPLAGSVRGIKRSAATRTLMSSMKMGWCPSLETRFKMSEAARGKPKPFRSAETRAKLSASSTGRKHSDATKALMSAQRAGRKNAPYTPERSAALSARQTGRKMSDATKVKISAANRGRLIGRTRSAETCAKIAAAKTGVPGPKPSLEARAKMSATRMGLRHSTETRAKISASHLHRWVRHCEVADPLKPGDRQVSQETHRSDLLP